ncbi:putative PabA-like protein [Croceivirga lutea]|uniref:aminodeoxychorismate synthase component I n=1 Tax=Croceivirga lutea TaxID=1775167 RepID=UPI0016399FDF|nr:aminodeoxychorismate synthase component I [Croceivirga lutea]GGG48973.1 putative PabA-like protein [Croceivirga lutea]
MNSKDFKTKVSRFLSNKKPFFFLVSFDKSQQLAFSFSDAEKQNILFNLNGIQNHSIYHQKVESVPKIEVEPYTFKDYLKGFETVHQNLKEGNSFLVNLTFPSKITSSLDLIHIYHAAKAKYKLLFKDNFVCFSPECFIKIKDGYIYSYPMKGTIDASIPNAEELLLNDEKERQEHNTIVDLIRNDLSIVAKEVTVTKFRYLDKITTAKGDILQTSTEIRGKLAKDWQKHFSSILLNMLPAGSISGAPKPKTIEIINTAENYERGFYTGVFGIFDGENIDSAVAIRFIEKSENEFWYKSGGGITHQSNVKEEYIELLNKIYIPTF